MDDSVIQGMALKRGLSLETEATATSLLSDPFRLTEADLLVWLANAPNVSEGGVQFDLLYSTRTAMRNQAEATYAELEDESDDSEEEVSIGYLGSDL